MCERPGGQGKKLPAAQRVGTMVQIYWLSSLPLLHAQGEEAGSFVLRAAGFCAGLRAVQPQRVWPCLRDYTLRAVST